jgi:integrase
LPSCAACVEESGKTVGGDATRLVRGRTDLVIAAELLGHTRLETTRSYSRPTRQDAIDALELLDVDR